MLSETNKTQSTPVLILTSEQLLTIFLLRGVFSTFEVFFIATYFLGVLFTALSFAGGLELLEIL